MAFLKVKNRAVGSLSIAVNETDTTWKLKAGQGVAFPDSGDFHVTCDSEIVKVVAIDGDTLTVERAQEGTTATAHPAGTPVELRITAKIIQDLVDRGFLTLADVPSSYAGHGGESVIVKANENGLEFSSSQSATAAYLSADQSVPDDTPTKIRLNGKEYDVQNEYDNTTNYRWTAKRAGKYLIQWCSGIKSPATAGGYIEPQIYKNGATAKAAVYHASSTSSLIGSMSCVMNLAANDYIEFYLKHTMGSGKVVYGSYTVTYFSIVKLA